MDYRLRSRIAERVVFLIFSVFMVFSTLFEPVHSYYDDAYFFPVYVNDRRADSGIFLKLINDEIYVSMEKMLGEYGMTTIVSNDGKRIDVFGYQMHIRFKPGSTGMLINGVRFEMQAPAFYSAGEIMIPLDDLIRMLGVQLHVDAVPVLRLYGIPRLHPQAGRNFSGKSITTRYSEDNYVRLLIEGDRLHIEVLYPYSGGEERVYFYHVYGNKMDYEHKKIVAFDGVAHAENEEQTFVNYYGALAKTTIVLKDMRYNVVNISKMKLGNDNYFRGKYECYYDYLIVKEGSEFYFDFPQSYLDNTDMMLELKSPDNYLIPELSDREDFRFIKNLSDDICVGAVSDREKVKRIHDWMVTNLYYDTDGVYGPQRTVLTEPVDVIRTGKTNCSGFSRLFQNLLRMQNIPCAYITGDTRNDIFETFEPLHAWNMVYVDGVWKIFDVTWNSNNEFESGAFIKKDHVYVYYDIDPFYFSYDHHMKKVE